MSNEPTKQDNGQDNSTSIPNVPKSHSPARAARSTSTIPQLNRSRKNSQEFSPTRNNALSGTLSTIPSAAAVQRALSAQRSMNTGNNLDGTLEGSRADRKSGNNSPSWPTSPRLKSPPPSATNNRQTLAKKPESEVQPSNTSMKRLATVASPESASGTKNLDSARDPAATHSAPRPTGRVATNHSTTLETVAEASAPTTPSIMPIQDSTSESYLEARPREKGDANSESSTIREGEMSGESGLKTPVESKDTGRSAPPAPPASSNRPNTSLAKRSFSSLTTNKSRPPDPPRTMTVETEPVSSMPQLIVGERGLSGRDGSGMVRTKPSSEAIKPKKEKKKTTRKTTSGTGKQFSVLSQTTKLTRAVASKADIFEAKVANAVDEADTSDSDETFVYESNPPDSRTHRHHSRTPSGTSLASQEQHGRNRHGIRNGSHAIGGKRSMKFSNSAANNNFDDDGEGSGRGSVRNASTPRRHHNISRHNRPSHASILDNNSPFTQAGKTSSPRNSASNLQRLARPNSPRLPNGAKKGDVFDVYDDVADDERAPLMNSVRVNRRGRRPHTSGFRSSEYFDQDQDQVERNYFGRFGGCLILGLVALIICVGVATFVVGLSQPLLNVKIRHLQNILASEQELMLDLHVDAVNTNIFAITVSDLDINLFAQSAYAGTSSEWQYKHHNLRWATRANEDELEDSGFPFGWPHFGTDDGVDEGTDPIDDPESGLQKMLLGRILEFDSPLTFEASPVRRTRSSSVGEIRLAKPGNKTEVGGTQRWERVLQHPFDLIVRGVIKYQLPLSSKIRSAKIASKAKVLPDDDGETNSTAPGL